MKKIYIVLLNYNGWRDTQECLENILKLDYPNYQIIVVDNDSPNQSMGHLLAWAKGEEEAAVDNIALANLSTPHSVKPVDFILYDKAAALTGGDKELERKFNNSPIVFIQAGENKGFSAGNNIGIEYVSKKGDAGYIWLLNTDTVVESSALTESVKKIQYYKQQKKKVGIIGSKLMYYHTPELIQGIGGKYNKWFATTSHIGAFEKDRGQYDNEDTVEYIDYPIGASMFVSIDYIKDIGLMCEDYFLYYEELDWVLRGKRKGWEIGYCWKAKIYHKEGGSIGSSSIGVQKSDLADYYALRNRVLFTRKFFKKYLFIVKLGFFVVIVNRLKRFKFSILKKIPRIVMS